MRYFATKKLKNLIFSSLCLICANFAKRFADIYMKKLAFLFAITLVSVSVSGQKEYKTIRSSLKSKNGDAALKTVQECQKNDKFKEDPELYHYGFEAYVRKNNTLNEQAYLKQKVDTAALFNSVYGLFEYALRCDTFDSKPNAKGKVKIRYRKAHESVLRRMYSNLNNGGVYFLAKSNFADAYKFLSMYINAPSYPVFGGKASKKDSIQSIRAAYWATVCAYQLKDTAKFFTYHERALADTVYRIKELELATEMYGLKGDTQAKINTLQTGMNEYPTNYYFFMNLLDYYNEQNQYEKALELANTMLEHDPRSITALYGKSLVFLKMKRYDDCITISQSIIQSDSTYTEAFYNTGASYYAKAVELDNQVKADMGMNEMRNIKREVDKLYRSALPYLEQYRTLAADRTDRWGKPLYRIYLSLNMGEKFEEIDKLLSQSDKAQQAEQKQTEQKKK